MAFCPNCGTPNTEQASKCVNCDNALTPAGGGGKFKGTIMMGVAGGAAPSPQQPEAPAQPPAGADAKNLAFQKTMMGPVGAPPPGPAPAPAPQQPAAHDVAHAPTVEQVAPTPQPASPSTPQRSFSQPAGGGYDDPPQLPQSNATKTMMIVLGASVVVAALIVGAALFLR